MLKISLCCSSTGRTQQTCHASVVGCLVVMLIALLVLYIINSTIAAQNGVATQISNEENQPDIRDCLPGCRVSESRLCVKSSFSSYPCTPFRAVTASFKGLLNISS